MKRIRNPSVTDIKNAKTVLSILQYYLEPKNPAQSAPYLAFSKEHHAAANERVLALYNDDPSDPGDFFNVRVHIVPFLSIEMQERLLGDCLEKTATLHVYPLMNRTMYKRVLEKHTAVHEFAKSRGLCIKSTITKKNVQTMNLLIHGARCFRGTTFGKDNNLSFIWTHMAADFAVESWYMGVFEEIDAIFVADVMTDYHDDAGVFTGVSRSGFYKVVDRTKKPIKLNSVEDIENMLMGKRVSLVPSCDKREDGTTYDPKISLKLTEGDAKTQTFITNGKRQLLDFEKPDAMLAAAMEKYKVAATGGTDVRYAMPAPAITKSANGKDISADSFLSKTVSDLAVTCSAWNFGSETVNFNKTEFTFAKIGAKFYPVKISIVKDTLSSAAADDPIASSRRDLDGSDDGADDDPDGEETTGEPPEKRRRLDDAPTETAPPPPADAAS